MTHDFKKHFGKVTRAINVDPYTTPTDLHGNEGDKVWIVAFKCLFDWSMVLQIKILYLLFINTGKIFLISNWFNYSKHRHWSLLLRIIFTIISLRFMYHLCFLSYKETICIKYYIFIYILQVIVFMTYRFILYIILTFS